MTIIAAVATVAGIGSILVSALANLRFGAMLGRAMLWWLIGALMASLCLWILGLWVPIPEVRIAL